MGHFNQLHGYWWEQRPELTAPAARPWAAPAGSSPISNCCIGFVAGLSAGSLSCTADDPTTAAAAVIDQPTAATVDPEVAVSGLPAVAGTS